MDYEVVGWKKTPVFVWVKADHVGDALRIGRRQIRDGLGQPGEGSLSDDWDVADDTGEPIINIIDGRIHYWQEVDG